MDNSSFLLGGAPWINLINTNYMQHKQLHDLLADPAQMAPWLQANELLADDAADESQAAVPAQTLEQLRAVLVSLRPLCRQALDDLLRDGALSEAVATQLQERVSRLQVGLRMAYEDGRWALRIRGAVPADGAAYRILASLLDTAGQVPSSRLRQCEHDDCVLYFVDLSKSGKRRWCSMEQCGNRRKAADFYAKKKQLQQTLQDEFIRFQNSRQTD